MDYCVIGDGSIITNIIVCDSDAVAHEFGAFPSYEGAGIGGEYNPLEEWLWNEETNEYYYVKEPEPTQLDRVEAQVTYTAMMTDTLLPEV